jgi:hypothetical protein
VKNTNKKDASENIRMISKINTTDFIKRLIYHTIHGNPKIKGTPFSLFTKSGGKDKIFYGSYNQTKFEITNNSLIALFIISGEIKTVDKYSTEVIYKIVPNGFGYYWNKYMIFIIVFVFNLILYKESVPLKSHILITLISFGLILLNHLMLRRKKNQLKNEFQKVFELENQKS